MSERVNTHFAMGQCVGICLMISATCRGESLELSRQVQKPNVLCFVVDDLNDWISLLDPDSPIKTPNLERLAQRGMLFTRAYCISPACNPSRAATWIGLRPSTTGVYGNKSDWRGATPGRKTVMQQFMANGYDVRGAGKIFHHHLDGAFHDEGSFNEYRPMRKQLYPERKLNRAPHYGSRNTDWGKWPKRESDSIDFATVEYCARVLREHTGGKPLFLACGIFKPHSPFFAPAKYHASLASPLLPGRTPNDWDDLPNGARSLLQSKRWFWDGMMQLESTHPGAHARFVESYAACVRFADAQIGRVLDSLDQSEFKENTIVVLWSDHGFHLGEKDHIEKFALWEKSNHIPFIVVAPGVTRTRVRCEAPIDMTVVYPTLLELCGLPADAACDGDSIVPLLRNPEGRWERPALTTYMQGNHAVRSRRWRYIRYADDTEELYDHGLDPHEWKNLASDSKYGNVLQWHRKWLPPDEADQVVDLKAGAKVVER